MRAERFLLIMAAALALATSAAAQDAEPALEVEVSNAVVSVGDRVPVRVLARGGQGWMWGELSVSATTGGAWEVVDGPRPVSGSRPPSWELILAPMEIGELDLPAISASIRPPDGEARAVSPGESPKLTVASVLPPEEDAPPAPMRDPLGVGGLPWEWLPPVLLFLLPFALALAWWLRWRRRGGAAAGIPALPPFEELKKQLDDLVGRVGREPAEGICDRLAEGLRRYLERRFGEPALEMTSFELRLMARRLQWPGPVQAGIQRIMDVADGVRFGRRAVADAALSSAVEQTGTVAQALENLLVPVDDAEQAQTGEASA